MNQKIDAAFLGDSLTFGYGVKKEDGLIDFDEVINRTKIYKDEERRRSENCNLLKMASKV